MNIDLVNQVADAYLQTSEGSDAARLRFLKGLWEIQSRFEATDRPYDAPDPDSAREALLSGRPLFLLSAPDVPLEEYVQAVSQIVRYASEMAGLPAEQAEALRRADFATAIGQERLDDVVASLDAFVESVARDMGAEPRGPLTPATVAFVLISALVPFLSGPSHSALEALGESDRSVWTAGTCPVCGADAAIGSVGESTKLQGAPRTLWCGVCHAEWSYERLRCVRCGSGNPNELRYTYIEGDPAHRLHLCDQCHGYTRFVFVDDLGKPLSMVVEDAVAVALHAVALHNGYTASGDGGQGSC